MLDYFDTSDDTKTIYTVCHKLIKKILGKIKDECSGQVTEDIFGFGAKM